MEEIKSPIKDIKFSVIRTRNDANRAETLDGFIVHREKQLWFNDATGPRFVWCAPYDNHFIYNDPSDKVGRWTQMCTCGSFAAVVGYKAYRKDASAPTTVAESTEPGEMLVCYKHATTGRHGEGST